MRKPVLCGPLDCLGCSACANCCPTDSIQMKPNTEGFLQPTIDYNSCNSCKNCEKSCPVLTRPILERAEHPQVYAGWHKDEGTRLASSSGGMFSAAAELVIEKKGIVFGAAYDENLHVHHRGVEHRWELDLLRRSKYVQSEIGMVYRQINEQLQEGREVLFIGTPCQVAGLYAFLKSEFTNLLTLDFICHGVPSPLVIEKYIAVLEKKLEAKLSDINFRDKKHGWENSGVVVKTKTGETHYLKGTTNSFYTGFILGSFLRESCYHCPFNGLPRFGDLTIADFWGINQDKDITQSNVDKGISLVMLNNESRSGLIKDLRRQAVLINRTLDEARNGNSPMFFPAPRPASRDVFFKELITSDYNAVARKYLTYSRKRQFIQFLKENLGKDYIARLRKIKHKLSNHGTCKNR